MPRKAVGNTFLQRTGDPTFFGRQSLIGKVHATNVDIAPPGHCEPYYQHPHGTLWLADCTAWLATLEPASVDLVFADPPYNIGKADWDEFDSHDQYIEWSMRWIELAARALKPTGSLYVCGFSEILADLRRPAAEFFPGGGRWLVWCYKNKANLSKDWGRSHESIIHYRKCKDFKLNIDDIRIPYGLHTLKYPEHPQAASSQYGNGKARPDAWQPHPDGAKPKDFFEIPVTSNGMQEKTPHPTQKPEELLRRLILAASSEGDQSSTRFQVPAQRWFARSNFDGAGAVAMPAPSIAPGLS